MKHLVQVGAMGHVGRFVASDGRCHLRGERVIVRTARGLECGEVLVAGDDGEPDGPLLRRMTVQDTLLAERLERDRDAAYRACVRLLGERGSASVLLEVEHLFDGRGLYFYFLGEPDDIAGAITGELASTYEAEARLGQFADKLEAGCGPGCGTDAAENGCSTGGGGSTGGGCASCGLATACSSGAVAATSGAAAAEGGGAPKAGAA